MKILLLYNNYQSGGGGETTMVRMTESILKQHGHEVHSVWKDNRNIVSLGDKLGAFFNGVYSPESRAEVAKLIGEIKPDVVHIFNLYPLLSPSVIEACKSHGVPVVMSVQNHQLTCPTAAHFSKGEVCERCMGGREHHCVLRNCKGSHTKSVGFALRSAVARRAGWYRKDIDRFLVISEAVRSRLLKDGYEDSKIRLLLNAVPVPDVAGDPASGEYVGFVGRLVVEKGISVLLEAARISGVPVVIAGGGEELSRLQGSAPKNVRFAGLLDRAHVDEFYTRARFTVVPSIWPEPFGLVATEAMSYGLPVIAARSGGLQEIIEHGETGFLYAPQDASELASHMKRLWDSPSTCAEMGRKARASVIEKYNLQAHYDALLSIYEEISVSVPA